MKPSGIVTLLTDFGTSEPFAGVMKGVLVRHFPAVRLIDLSHEMPPGDVTAAAFWLALSAGYFPAGTVHLAVIDPGVGSARAPLVVEAGEQLLVGPDNGLFELVMARHAPVRARRIDAERHCREVSRTFHGRDVFAPIAARLASGELPFDEVGPEHAPEGRLALAPAQRTEGQAGRVRYEGRVLIVDHFGNLISNIEPARELTREWRVELDTRAIECGATYADARPGEPIAYVGSFGQVEVGVRDGNAARVLGAGRGARLSLEGPAS